MINDFKIVKALREKYSDIHPLIFHRSVEQSSSPGELFDILDTIPKEFPLIWDFETKRWIKTKDLVLFNKFDIDPSRS